MVYLTFYGGVNEIGGNKILLEDKGVRVFFDFGESFSIGEGYTLGYLGPRDRLGLMDYFALNLLPKIKGLYSEKVLQYTDFMYEKPKFNAIFISHCHSDHISHIKFVDPNIPIFLGHGTKAILDISQKTSHQIYNFGKEGHDYRTFKSGDKIKIKHLVIEPVHVDHSIPGAYGFIIHTSRGAIVYTGDLRMHGPASGMTREFLIKAKEAEPIALISEGTRIGFKGKNWTENDVMKAADNIVSNSKKLVLADIASRNIDRIRTFYKVAVKNNRIFVIDTKMAALMHALKDKCALPDVFKDKNIKIYFKQKRSCSLVEDDYYVWERQFMKNMVTYKWVHKNQNKLVMATNLYQFFEFISIKPKPNSDYIYSMSEHFLEGPENIEAMNVRKNWLEFFKFRMPSVHKTYDENHEPVRMYSLHASGHMPQKDIVKMIKQISPDKVIPIHTDDPKMFKNFYKKVVLPEFANRIKI